MEQAPKDTRTGNTEEELQKWLVAHTGDESLKAEAEYVEGIVTGWREGQSTAIESARQLYQRYFETEGSVSEAASAMLIQSADLYFSYEADLSHEVCWGLYEEERDKAHGRPY